MVIKTLFLFQSLSSVVNVLDALNSAVHLQLVENFDLFSSNAVIGYTVRAEGLYCTFKDTWTCHSTL